MADTFTRAQRSKVMARIRGKDTTPEITVRRILHRMGYRFRLHALKLPGRPDIVLTRHRTVVQVHGCFWHAHHCLGGRVPPGLYWAAKFVRNRLRDRRNRRQLRAMGWRVLTVWECRVRRSTPGELAAHIARLLDPSPNV